MSTCCRQETAACRPTDALGTWSVKTFGVNLNFKIRCPVLTVSRSGRRKWSNVAVLSGLSLIIALASSMFAPGVPEVIADFQVTNKLLATFVVSVYVLGFAM